VGDLEQVPPTPQLQLTETIRNDVNLKKQTLRLLKSEEEPSKYRLDFIFDAATACTVSIWYLAEEKTDNSNNTLSFETQYHIQPQTIKFEPALGQRYVQAPEFAFDVSLVQNRGQMYYHQGSQHFPVIIMLQTCEDNRNRVQSQSTFATFKSNGDGTLSIGVVKQKIQVQGNAYELQEIYGIEQGQNDAENSKECVICMSAPKDTTVLPCRHMCMCRFSSPPPPPSPPPPSPPGPAPGLSARARVGEEHDLLYNSAPTYLQRSAVCSSASAFASWSRLMCICGVFVVSLRVWDDSDCAKVLRYQTNKCPICRCSVESLLQIKVNSTPEAS